MPAGQTVADLRMQASLRDNRLYEYNVYHNSYKLSDSVVLGSLGTSPIEVEMKPLLTLEYKVAIAVAALVLLYLLLA
jgi:hypothetical protein